MSSPLLRAMEEMALFVVSKEHRSVLRVFAAPPPTAPPVTLLVAAAVGTLQGVATQERVCKPGAQGLCCTGVPREGALRWPGGTWLGRALRLGPGRFCLLPPGGWGSHVYPQGQRMSFSFLILQGSSWLNYSTGPWPDCSCVASCLGQGQGS